MYKVKLENLINKASEVFIKQGDILVTAEGYYIDQRTKQDPETKLWIVVPIAHMNGHYWYVCPDCQEIHFTDLFGWNETETFCCTDQRRHQKFKGDCFMIKRNLIIFDDGC